MSYRIPRTWGAPGPVDARDLADPALVAFFRPRVSSDSPTDRQSVQVGKFVGKRFG